MFFPVVLMAGPGPFKVVNAAGITRYTNAGWSEAATKQTEKYFKEITGIKAIPSVFGNYGVIICSWNFFA